MYSRMADRKTVFMHFWRKHDYLERHNESELMGGIGSTPTISKDCAD